MKSEKEIRELYEEMLINTELLKDKVRNHQKYDDVSVGNIQGYIDNENLHYHLNALMKWVLND